MNENEEAHEISDHKALENILTYWQSKIKTSMPARVEKYDSDKMMVQVKPLFNHVYLDEDTDEEVIGEYPIINNVPVMFPWYGNFLITFPVAVGDNVWLDFSDRSLDKLMETDGKTIIDPIDGRMHDINDAVAFFRFPTAKNKPSGISSTHLVLRSVAGDIELHLTPGKEIQTVADAHRFGSLSANKALAVSDKVNTRCGDIETKLNVVITFITGLGFPGGPIAPGSSVASSKVFTNDS
jgi:hypothetical protein